MEFLRLLLSLEIESENYLFLNVFLYLVFVLYREYFLICPEGGSVISTACDSYTDQIFCISLLYLKCLYCYLSEHLKYSTNSTDLSITLLRSCMIKLVYIYLIDNTQVYKSKKGKQTPYWYIFKYPCLLSVFVFIPGYIELKFFPKD